MTAVSGASYAGALLAAVLLLAAAWYGTLRGRLPPALWGAVLLAAFLATLTGYLAERYWRRAGQLPLGDGMRRTVATRAIDLLVSDTYLRELGLPPAMSSFLRSGLHEFESERGAAIRFKYAGFSLPWWERREYAVSAFVRAAADDMPIIAFTARLLTTRTADALVRLLLEERRPFGRRARMLLREHLPELRDRFPAAGRLLDELERRIGGLRRAATPPAGADP